MANRYFSLAETIANEFKKLILEDDVDAIESALKDLVTTEQLQTLELKEILLELLMHNTPNINLLVAKTIAEITKTPEQRAKFSNNDILEKLMEMLNVAISNRKQSESLDLIVQLCRSFGNIFYSNDDARNIIFHIDGGKILIKLLDLSCSEIPKSNFEVFSKVRSGVMSNYLLGNEELSQKAIELGVVDKIKIRLQESTECIEHLLPLLSILTEQVSDLIFQPEILILITKILKNCTNCDVVETSLELLLCQAESDEVKLLLAREGLCEHIFTSIDKYKAFDGSVETKHLVKLSCDLIVLILTGGE